MTILSYLAPTLISLLALGMPLAVLARWVHGDDPGRPPARTDSWSAGTLPSRPYADLRR